MEPAILNGVGKKTRNGYLNGQIPESTVIAMYKKNKKEADSFSLFGYTQREIEAMLKETHNPLLKQKLQDCLASKREISKKCSTQNEINLAKLENFKKEACGVGLRKVIKLLGKLAKTTKDHETKLLQLLLETEYANLSAKQHKGYLKEIIYERKTILLYQMADFLEELGWRYGINDEAGKNACYLVYVYLPNNIQLTWHCNEYEIYECYPTIDAEWDGQVCMTMDKILSYIDNKYFHNKLAG
jgi:hypothetical protein